MCCDARRQKVAAEGSEALPQRIAIVTGKGRGKEDEGGLAAREAVAAILTASASPFQVCISPDPFLLQSCTSF